MRICDCSRLCGFARHYRNATSQKVDRRSLAKRFLITWFLYINEPQITTLYRNEQCMLKKSLPIFFLALTMSANAQSLEDNLRTRYIGRTGAASADHRENEFALRTPIGPGPKTGCHGDTFNASVRINSVNVSVSGDVATITATFDGKYTRQLWITPCVESPGPNGHEDRNVSGTLTMTLKQIPFRNVEVSFGTVSNVGEVSDPNHDFEQVCC